MRKRIEGIFDTAYFIGFIFLIFMLGYRTGESDGFEDCKQQMIELLESYDKEETRGSDIY